MLGLLFYMFVAVGIGAWLPALKLGGARSLGAGILGGYAVTLLALFLLHAVLRVPLAATSWLIVGAAGVGWVLAARRFERHVLTSPAVVLPLVAALAIAANGGIGYQPFTIDEFTNWIGVSREIYLHGGYEPIRATVHFPGYLPGWRLLLPLPWVVGGAMDFGQSASAPLVFHVGLVTLIYEVIRHEAKRHRDLDGRLAMFIAWGVVLLYLAAEGTGKLWTYELLIEQPQIYALTACLLYLYLLKTPEIRTDRLLLHAGLAVVAGYLLKAAMLTFLPGLLLVIGILVWRPAAAPSPNRLRDLASKSAVLILPTLALMLLWKGVVPESAGGCLSNPLATLTPDAIAKIFEADLAGLFVRMAAAIGGYVASYKTVVLLAAAGGAAVAAARGNWLWLLAFGAFAAVYFAALYWYHLTCFGPYYFETLNSIPRFTRVVIQPFHAVGLVALALAFLGVAAPRAGAAPIGRDRFYQGAAFICSALLVWQFLHLLRTAEDVTDRRHQTVDPRIAQVRAAADFVRDTVPADRRPPLVQFVSQGTDADLLGYARMFALDGTRGRPHVLFRFAREVSWNPTAATNAWQTVASREQLAAAFRNADIIWPIKTDGFVTRVLLDLAASADCAAELTDRVFVKSPDGAFQCPRKPAAPR